VRQEVSTAVRQIARCLEVVLKNPLFSFIEAEKLQLDVRQGEENLKAATERVQMELSEDARVFLCTIGSSHKLPTSESEDNQRRPEAYADDLPLAPPAKPTIVVFDEAGCIPCFEFLGLTRLGRDIKAIVCVGDKHQLAPFNPGASNRPFQPIGRFQGRQPLRAPLRNDDVMIPSLLDVSELNVDSNDKIRLTEQYRMPHDIAGILNARVYKGNYRTALICKAPLRGFSFISVDAPIRARDDKFKYVNRNEINYCVDLVDQAFQDGHTSIMVLTPVS
jgi:hypothetical protein